MSLYAMPFVIVNLGAEMVFILDQRLGAQKVAKERAQQVIDDLLLNMFQVDFVNELFRPQRVYSIPSTRAVFQKIAHSSIMKLSEESMEKLYDLMLMGLKYQVLCIERPEQVVEVTLRHLDIMSAMGQAPAVKELLGSARARVLHFQTDKSAGDWLLVRRTICQFLQDKRIKVSLFLQEGIQSGDAKMFLRAPQREAGLPPPGTWRVLEPKSKEVAAEGFQQLSKRAKMADLWYKHPDPIGTNLYAVLHTKCVDLPTYLEPVPASSSARTQTGSDSGTLPPKAEPGPSAPPPPQAGWPGGLATGPRGPGSAGPERVPEWKGHVPESPQKADVSAMFGMARGGAAQPSPQSDLDAALKDMGRATEGETLVRSRAIATSLRRAMAPLGVGQTVRSLTTFPPPDFAEQAHWRGGLQVWHRFQAQARQPVRGQGCRSLRHGGPQRAARAAARDRRRRGTQARPGRRWGRTA